MISVYEHCPSCSGIGYDAAGNTCLPCERTGRRWSPGAPSFGLAVTLADRDPGEIVTLGNGEQAKILWHMPRKTKKVRPETTFLGLIDPFTEVESHRPISYPSCVGVASVEFSRAPLDTKIHDNERSIDDNDPIHRQVAGRLI